MQLKQSTVLIVEDHPIVRESLAAFVEASDGVALWGTAVSGEDAISQLNHARHRPRIALTDLSMPGIDGLNLVSHIQDMWPDVACIILSAHRASAYAARAEAVGAMAYVEKSDLTGLIEALQRVG